MLKSDALRFFGGPTKLAKLLGLKSRQTIYAWPEVVPDLYQYKLYYLSEQKLALSPGLQPPLEPAEGRAAA